MRHRSRALLFLAASSVALAGGAGLATAQAAGAVETAAQQVAPSDPFAHSSSDVQPDASVRYGLLSNGMRYAILHNSTPPAQASLKLRIDAGSLMERDDQKGLAHFTEHMAFNGTRAIPENEMMKMLERVGLQFGADSNAFTGFDQTAYELDLPNTKNETVDTSLFVLREMVSAALMTSEAIDEERGVIVGEQRIHDTPSQRVGAVQMKLLAPGQRLSDRRPIGDLEIIRTAPRERFVDFYSAYYRPSRATLIAVGDFDVDAMETKIRTAFADWRPSAPDGAEPDLGVIQQRGAETRLVVEPGVQARMAINWIRPPEKKADTNANRIEAIQRGLGLAVLNRRFSEMAMGEDPPFLGASGSQSDLYDSLSVGSFSLAYNAADWRRALETVEQEGRRFAMYGVTDAELQREVVERRSQRSNAAASAATRSTLQLASALLNSVNGDRVFTSPQSDLDLFEQAVNSLTPDKVNGLLKPMFEGQGPVILAASPAPIEGGEAAITTAYQQSQLVPVSPSVIAKAISWPYESFGKPATPTSRTAISELGVILVQYPNGVRLNIKKTAFKDNEIQVNVRVDGGELLLSATEFSPALLMDQVLTPGGLGKLTLQELDRGLAGRTFGASGGLGERSIDFSGRTTPTDLTLQMQILTAYLTDPGLRTNALDKMKAAYAQNLSQMDMTPSGVFQRDAEPLLAGGDARRATPTAAQVEAITADEIRAQVGEMLKRGEVQVTVVGDIDVDAVIAAVGSTLGALPTRASHPAAAPSSLQRRLPAPSSTPVRLHHAGLPTQALGFVAWPTTDAITDRTVARQLTLLSAILRLRVIEEIREKRSLAYSPSVMSTNSDAFPGYGYVAVTAETDPEKVSTFYSVVDDIVRDLRENPVMADELNRARLPMVERARRQRTTNDYWSSQLSEIQTKPEHAEQILHGIEALEAITPEQLQALAAKYLRDDTAWRLEVLPKPTKD
jgi:zinc protease